MKPKDFPEKSFDMQPPPDMLDCVPLPVFRNPDGGFISLWKPTWKERLSIFLFGRVWLGVVSNVHPPVWIWGVRRMFEPPKPPPEPATVELSPDAVIVPVES